MKTVNTKQLGFFDPASAMVLLALFGVAGAAIETANPGDSVIAVETQPQMVCSETETTVVREDFYCN